MSDKLVVLCMIVKDEVKNLRKTLDSVLGQVDGIVILDTGSTDGTQNLIRDCYIDFSSASTPPVHLAEQSFVDFAASRNLVLDLADEKFHPVFTLMLSGDETLHGNLRLQLEKLKDDAGPAYCIEMRSENQSWPYSRILRARSGWRYRGENQERPVAPDGSSPALIRLADCHILHAPTDPERRVRRLRDLDLPVLMGIVSDKDRTDGDRAQALFHLGSTCAALAAEEKDAGERHTWQHRAVSYFHRYALLAGADTGPARDPVKARYAQCLALNVLEKMIPATYFPEEILARLALLADQSPEIPEVHLMLAAHAARMDTRKGLFLALRAAEVASHVKRNPTHLPTDTRLESLALLIACSCATEQKKDRNYVKALATKGIAAGGTEEQFKEYL